MFGYASMVSVFVVVVVWVCLSILSLRFKWVTLEGFKPTLSEMFAPPNIPSFVVFCFLPESSRKSLFRLNPLRPLSDVRVSVSSDKLEITFGIFIVKQW